MKNYDEVYLKDINLKFVSNIYMNVYIALDDRMIVVFTIGDTSEILTKFGLLNVDRLNFRNELSLEDLE